MKWLRIIQLMAIRLLKVIRFICAALAVYFLFVTLWQTAYLHKVRQWPVVQARLIRRQTTFYKSAMRSPRVRGDNYGMTFVEEMFDVPSTRVSVSARDFGYLSPRAAEQQRRKRERQVPVGSIMPIRINPRYPTEATTLGSEQDSGYGRAESYGLYALGCIVLYALLRTIP